jgi:excisionase family DNA binding protein
MNQESKQTLTITINGQLTIGRTELEQLLRELRITSLEEKQPVTSTLGPVMGNQGTGKEPPRLAYNMRETAEVLGVHYQTVYRLLKRGLLRSSGALRRKVISKAEIERFLKETSQSIF